MQTFNHLLEIQRYTIGETTIHRPQHPQYHQNIISLSSIVICCMCTNSYCTSFTSLPKFTQGHVFIELQTCLTWTCVCVSVYVRVCVYVYMFTGLHCILHAECVYHEDYLIIACLHKMSARLITHQPPASIVVCGQTDETETRLTDSGTGTATHISQTALSSQH